MAEQNTHKGFTTYTIQSASKNCSMTFVPARGGMATSLKMHGKQGEKELLYHHDFLWDEHIDDLPGAWPFCFPVCARMERDGQYGAYLYDGNVYHLPIHGFAWNMPWEVLADDLSQITLRLAANKDTLQNYPFEFEVLLRYELGDNALACHQTYTNHGNKPMPYAAGFHPYFLTPPVDAGKADVELFYEPVKRWQYNERMTDIVGELPLFALPSSVSNPEINEQLTVVGENKQTQLFFPDGDVLHMVAEGVEHADLFSYVQLYTMQDKPFICVEPWMAFPNAMNCVQGMRWLAPGASETGVLKLWLQS